MSLKEKGKKVEQWQKLKDLDIAKGIGIILVVIGHALSVLPSPGKENAELLRTIIYLVHMPLFFFISGLLFEKNIKRYEVGGVRSYIFGKAKLYLIPYIIFSILLYIIVALALHIEPISKYAVRLGAFTENVPTFLLSILTYQNPIDEHLWFSYVMFLVLVVSFLLKRLNLTIMICIYFIGYVSTWFISYPELIWKTLRYMLIFTAGRTMWKRDIQLTKKTSLFSFIVGTVFTAIYLLLKSEGLVWMSVVKPFSEIGLVLVLLSISGYLEKAAVSGVLKRIGDESYAIYLIHQPYIVPLVVTVFAGTRIRNYFAIFISLTLGVWLPMLLSKYVIKRNKALNFFLLGGH